MEALQHIWQFTLENVRSFEEETFEDSAWLYSMSFIALIYLAISLKLFSVTNNSFVRVTFN